MWGRGIAPVPTSYFPEPFRLGPVPHTGHLPRAIKLHRQNTSLVPVGRGNAPSPHVSKMRAVPRGPELMDNTRIFIGDTKITKASQDLGMRLGRVMMFLE